MIPRVSQVLYAKVIEIVGIKVGSNHLSVKTRKGEERNRHRDRKTYLLLL